MLHSHEYSVWVKGFQNHMLLVPVLTVLEDCSSQIQTIYNVISPGTFDMFFFISCDCRTVEGCQFCMQKVPSIYM